MRDEGFRPTSELDDEGIPDHEGPLPAKDLTGDGQEGLSPPRDRPVASLDWGTTNFEQRHGEPLDVRLARDEPDLGPGDLAYADAEGTGGEPAGRIVEPDEGVREDVDKDVVAYEALGDGSGLTAEEAAMHIEREA